MGGLCGGVCCVGVCVRSPRRACVASCRPGGWEEKLAFFCCRGKDLQTSLSIWWTSLSVLGRGYASFGLRPTRLRTLWMAWSPQVRDCCRLGGGLGRLYGPASTCVWAVGMAQIQGTVPVGGQRRWIQWVRQSMANPRW